MHYRSLLFPGVLIAAIASLLIVQSCTKNDQAGTESNRAGAKFNRTVTEFELVHVHSQALSYLQVHFPTIVRQKGYKTTQQKLDYDEYLQNKAILENWCKTGDRDACKLSLGIQDLEGTIIITIPMEDLIGK